LEVGGVLGEDGELAVGVVGVGEGGVGQVGGEDLAEVCDCGEGGGDGLEGDEEFNHVFQRVFYSFDEFHAR
jgi:hypothetical protein